MYNTTELDSSERAALEDMVRKTGVVATAKEIGVKPDTLRRARDGEGLRDHVLDRFRRVLHPDVDARTGLTASERKALVEMVNRRITWRGESKGNACATLALFLQREAALEGR